eukprot:405955_1
MESVPNDQSISDSAVGSGTSANATKLSESSGNFVKTAGENTVPMSDVITKSVEGDSSSGKVDTHNTSASASSQTPDSLSASPSLSIPAHVSTSNPVSTPNDVTSSNIAPMSVDAPIFNPVSTNTSVQMSSELTSSNSVSTPNIMTTSNQVQFPNQISAPIIPMENPGLVSGTIVIPESLHNFSSNSAQMLTSASNPQQISTDISLFGESSINIESGSPRVQSTGEAFVSQSSETIQIEKFDVSQPEGHQPEVCTSQSLVNDKSSDDSEMSPADTSMPAEPSQTTTDQTETQTPSESNVCIDFTLAPKLVWQATEFPKIRDISASVSSGNFLKGCQWSPDGLCLLTNSEDNCLRVFEVPADILQGSSDTTTNDPPVHSLTSVLKMQESETVFDFCWYPQMSSASPETCCLASTCRDHPIHMWDAFTGKVKASFRAYDHADEITAAFSVSFTPDGAHLYAGYKDTVRVFDVKRAGRDCDIRSTKGKNRQGVWGMISCLDFSPDGTYYALGSYSGQAGIYSSHNGALELKLVNKACSPGLTQVRFTPDSTYLLCGARKSPTIAMWDVRNTQSPVATFRRPCPTNQRVCFDLDHSGRFLLTGGSDGVVRVYDVYGADETPDPISTFDAHSDLINGTSMHPFAPFMATTSGQRHYVSPQMATDSDGSESESEQICEDNRLLIWRLQTQMSSSSGPEVC